PPPSGPVPPLRPMEDADANKSAAQRLRQRMAAGRKTAATGAAAAGEETAVPAAASEAAAAAKAEAPAEGSTGATVAAEGGEEEEGGPRQRRRRVSDEDVSTAPAAEAEEKEEKKKEEKEMQAPEPVAEADGVVTDWTFSELQNMAVRPDDLGGEALAAEGEAPGAVEVEVSEEEALEVLAGHVGPEEESELEVAAAAADPAAAAAAAADMKERLEELMKSRSDRFDEMFVDEERIRLGEEGWKDRYYHEKLRVPAGPGQQRMLRSIVAAYVEGLCWVMKYYYEGVASWRWFYPFHYAPFASDLVDLAELDIRFELGQPFSPFNQLMGVLPAASMHCLPKPFRKLFTDPDSPILDFYPTQFEVDMNGKRYAWQGVALLPFIDESRLLAATGPLLPLLEPEEAFRNSTRSEVMYLHAAHPLAPAVYEMESACGHLAPEERGASATPLDPALSRGVHGFMLLCAGETQPSVVPVPFQGLGSDVLNNSVLCITYRLPPHLPHQPRIMEGTQLDPPLLTEADRPVDQALWHERGAGRGPPHTRDLSAPMVGDPALRMLNFQLGYSGRGGPPPPVPRNFGGGGGGAPYEHDPRGGPPGPAGYHHQQHQYGGGGYGGGGGGGGGRGYPAAGGPYGGGSYDRDDRRYGSNGDRAGYGSGGGRGGGYGGGYAGAGPQGGGGYGAPPPGGRYYPPGPGGAPPMPYHHAPPPAYGAPRPTSPPPPASSQYGPPGGGRGGYYPPPHHHQSHHHASSYGGGYGGHAGGYGGGAPQPAGQSFYASIRPTYSAPPPGAATGYGAPMQPGVRPPPPAGPQQPYGNNPYSALQRPRDPRGAGSGGGGRY
ncbi:hypothetical protein Agub_g9685, partial [Astrephomene gubernaculifera]